MARPLLTTTADGKTEIRQLPGLNGLRFIAASLVVLQHSYEECTRIGLAGDVTGTVILQRGVQAVDFFFTLSGFLITYLLLQEFHRTRTISLKSFYLRRACRIWPLYFVVLGLGFLLLGVIFPRVYHQRYFDFSFGYGLFMYLVFLPHWMAAFHRVGLLLPLWSIGVEEQFYVFWAPLAKRFGKRVFALVAVFLAVTLAASALIRAGVFSAGNDQLAFFLERLRFHYMAVGCLFAALLFHKGEWLRRSFIVGRPFTVLTAAVLAWYYIFGIPVSGAAMTALDLVLALFFGSLMVQVSVMGRWLSALEWKPVDHLGKISYGIYMYHMVFAYIVRVFMARYAHGLNFGLCVALFAIVFACTIVTAHLSYQTVESYFLNIGHRRYSVRQARTVPATGPVRPTAAGL